MKEVKTKVKVQEYVRMGPTRVPGDMLLLHNDRELKGQDWVISTGNRLHESRSHALSPDFPSLQGIQSPTLINLISVVSLSLSASSSGRLTIQVQLGCAQFTSLRVNTKKQRKVGNLKTEIENIWSKSSAFRSGTVFACRGGLRDVSVCWMLHKRFRYKQTEF